MEFSESLCVELFKIYCNLENLHDNIRFKDENSLFEKYYRFEKNFKEFIKSKKDGPALDIDIGSGRNII